ncbi:acetoacetate-CoA ligase [Punctularia strigosozonata HHB-11173 SS5]|uniref:acetoacetate-CoA ligase n=1 Tax=Punctularia strigosozonata (strain HHB-11173) TaxID=741275 RepID=UPI0004417B20|nr:acetoacetate-CoA ligase [Punctularia strigosozonata HHB-11173 SS5]EIN10628.1 acetoacetate-CoA ligase [Punctularia strigosozonata HHB-11173 SS5]
MSTDLGGEAPSSALHSRPEPLYVPGSPHSSRTFKFLDRVNQKYGLHLASYSDLYQWSTGNALDEFWSTVWDETDILGVKGGHIVDTSAQPDANPTWFADAQLNWAENMLWCRAADKCALIEATEPTLEDPEPEQRRITYAELYDLVADLVSALLLRGLRPGDRVASYSSNCIENVAACLAATAIGCIWVSAAADFGPMGVLERFEQVQPKIIFSVDAVVYNGKVHHHLPKLASLLDSLKKRVPEMPQVVVIPKVSSTVPVSRGWENGWISWRDFVDSGTKCRLGRTPDGEIEWRRQSFDWPLWILFSSGTTGRPKPIVHRAGGMLLQLRKELAICADIGAEDVFFYYTTTGWMMWNFLVSGLSIGCTLVLYDGSPLRDPAYLWRLVDELGITIFGTSAKYLDQLSKGYRPAEHHRLSTLKHIYSTGSPLAPLSYDYVYSHIKKDVLLASITGGTDICSLFAGMCTALPVYRGEIQCRELGMAITAFTETGTPSGPDEAGELVCLRPFPCMPVGFWPLPGYGTEDAVRAAQVRFQEAYFKSQCPGVWYHGDHVLITESREGNGGGVVMLGRSDGVLNPGGVRFGSAEIYDVLDACFAPSRDRSATETIVDCLAVGQKTEGGADERVVLFIKLQDGHLGLTKELEQSIKAEIRTRRSPRHVPARIVQVEDVPYTLNGKRVEVPVKKIINGAPVSSVNPATLRNPECLDEYTAIGERLRAEDL